MALCDTPKGGSVRKIGLLVNKVSMKTIYSIGKGLKQKRDRKVKE